MNATAAHHEAASPDEFTVFYDKAFAEVYRYLSAAVFGDQALAEGQVGSAMRMIDSMNSKTSIRPALSHSYELSLQAIASCWY